MHTQLNRFTFYALSVFIYCECHWFEWNKWSKRTKKGVFFITCLKLRHGLDAFILLCFLLQSSIRWIVFASLNWFNLTNFWPKHSSPKANANQLRFYDSPLEMLSRLKRTAISHFPSLFVLSQVALKKWKLSKEKVRAFSILPNEKLPVSLSIFINPSIFKQFR